MTIKRDETMMRLALAEARRGWANTRPNPHVGCIIVRGEKVVARGYHERAGTPHAERNAIAQAKANGEDLRGTEMFVTLEPCNHQGRTGPCTDAILEEGIARVVIAQRDPNEEARGGVEKLCAAGVDVVTGVCEQEALLLNPAFNTFHMRSRPLVTLKWAMSADGCTSTHTGHSAWISNNASRRRVHAMRAEHDAVLVGIETAIQDNARLTIRNAPLGDGPPRWRAVLDSKLRLPNAHPLLSEEQGNTLIICGESASKVNEAQLRNAGAEVWRVAEQADGNLSIPAVVGAFHKNGVQSIFVEGGRRVAASFLASRMVDRIEAFIAPILIGAKGDGHPLSALVGGNPPETMDDALRLHHAKWESLEGDAWLSGWLSEHLFLNKRS